MTLIKENKFKEPNNNSSKNGTDNNKLESILNNVFKPLADKHAEKLDKIIENKKMDF